MFLLDRRAERPQRIGVRTDAVVAFCDQSVPKAGGRHSMNESNKPVLICYDDSDSARRAIDAAADLLPGRRTVVLNVGPHLTPLQSYVETFAPVIPNFKEDNARTALERATEGAEQADNAGLDAVARGDVADSPWEGIVHHANDIDAAVIVIGSHGRNAGGEFLHGSVSHQVAEHAGRPVLIVPPARS
jgi:nucleotide-binding universal stress UspA family protein